MKLSTRWTDNPDSYSYHMLNKPKLVSAMYELFSSASLGWNQLAGIVIKKEWCVPEQNDFPNYSFVYQLCQDYIAYSLTIEKPVAEGIVYENVVRYLASLAKQDPAYYTRFNGILFRIIRDYMKGKIRKTDNLEYMKSLIQWWDAFDGRERNHALYMKFLNHIAEKYETESFYRESIDFCLNWVGEHKAQFVYSDDMNPKKWYGNNEYCSPVSYWKYCNNISHRKYQGFANLQRQGTIAGSDWCHHG